jgi:hypothetical protein
VSAIYHRHRGGNQPHVHQGNDGLTATGHDHVETHHPHHRKDPHDSHNEHGAHTYDVHGHQPAAIIGDPNLLGHWHFDSPFEHVALVAICEISQEFDSTVALFINSSLKLLPQAARPPPAIV